METANNWTEIIAKKDARIAELEMLVKFYEEQFRLSKHRQFGPSSEKGTLSGQLGLFDEAENEADLQKSEPGLEEITYARRKRIGKRKDDLSALPVETVEHTLPEEERVCPECGGMLHEMGHDTRRELVIIPPQVKVVEHRRAVLSCRNCEKNGDHVPIVKAEMPKPLISGSLASPSAVAHIITQKYVQHTPLYRQEQDWKRQGVRLSRQTMANWIIRCSEDWLLPIYERMKAILLTQDVLHADESTVQVLREPGKTAVSNSYMWLYRTSGDTKRQIVLFEYQPSRSSTHPRQFLKGFRGFLHTDGYAAYHTLPGVTVVGCWVHMRRKFEDALKAIPDSERAVSSANDAVRRIGLLFHLEEQWESLTPEERYKLRLEKSKPLAEAFFGWLQTLTVLPKTAMGKAVHYALEQREWLMNVYLDGRTELSNNRAENAVRPFALGRKNWLFCNAVKGAISSSVVYSIIETAKANGLLPFEYMKFLLETVPSTSVGELDALLPWGEAIPEKCRMPLTKENA
ncbi:IS66 family transposase [Desulforamulus ferrireducens]|uniref:Transposase n=1 Tax=Desulforamulus ferrireducens TaxID=1833852 RepID=A0A1S6IY74_9FIRM|nr:IS66 family transposase [Desulforamulus ferrireducens]AQS59706.1 transposase [Desulforamulus ferrireducens]